MSSEHEQPPQYTRYRAGRPAAAPPRRDETPVRAGLGRAPQRRVYRDRAPGGRARGRRTGAGADGPHTAREVAPLDQAEADPPHAARARRVLARALARAVPAQLALRAHVPAGERRRRARSVRQPVDVGQQHPRARLRPAPEGLEGTGRRNHGAGPLGHDHADPHRRRARGAALDPARHRRRNPRSRPGEDQRRPRVRRAGGVGLGDQELASTSRSTTSSKSTSKTSRS